MAAVLTLAVGIGGNTAVFSAVNGVLLRPLAYRNADRLVTIAHTTKGGDIPKNLPGASATHVVYTAAKSFQSIALYQPGKITLTGSGSPERVAIVTNDPQHLLGTRAFLRGSDAPSPPKKISPAQQE